MWCALFTVVVAVFDLRLGEFRLDLSPGETLEVSPGETQRFWMLRSLDTLPKTNIAPENRPSQKESSIPVFQPSIFRCYVSFREGTHLEMTEAIPLPSNTMHIHHVSHAKNHPQAHLMWYFFRV